jgi:Flp pilus assembly pilin Flp
MSELADPQVPLGWQGVSPYGVAADPVDWRHEAVVLGLVTAFSTLLGGAVGPIWHALAPKLNLVSAENGSAAATKALLSDDIWFGLIGIAAGVFCVAVVAFVSPRLVRGPGAMLGLAVGGLLGSLVAAHVGHHIGHDDMLSALHRIYPDAKPGGIRDYLGFYDFKVRAAAVVLGWPLAAVVIAALVTLGHQLRDTWQAPTS